MMNELTDSTIKYIIARVIDNANDAVQEEKENPGDEFRIGLVTAYYEVLDTIKGELAAHDQNLKEFGLDIDLEKAML